MIISHSLAELIVQELRPRIWDGEIPAETRLTETELAQEFQVSRSSVREALHLLEHEGLVDIIPRRGAFVRRFTAQDLEDLYAVRVLLETYAFQEASHRITEEGYQDLMHILESMEQAFASDDWRSLGDLDLTLHFTVVQWSGNAMVVRLYESIRSPIRASMGIPRSKGQRRDLVVAEHRRLIHALRSGDQEAIRQAVTTNLQDGKILAQQRRGAGQS